MFLIMNNKKKKLNEESILKRLSNGAMYQVNGGRSNSFTDSDNSLQPSLGDCLAGCGCTPHRACNTCQASV